MTPSPPQRVELLAWDTAFWDVQAARVHAVTEAELDEADARCRELDVQWASLLAPVADTALVNRALARGFEVVDVRVTLTTSLDPSKSSSSGELAGDADADQMASIAATAFPISRFSVDQHLDDKRCELFYETWLRNSMTKELADAVLVSRSEGEVDGFMTVRSGADHTGSLPLVAVRADRRGQGVGRRLLSDALGWFSTQGVVRVDVVTQLSNFPAIRLYESRGFRLLEAGFWLHRWY